MHMARQSRIHVKLLGIMLLIIALVQISGIPASVLNASNTAQTTFFVDPNGDDAADCTSPETACQSINAALDKASADDNIQIADGVYTEYLDIDKNINILGTSRNEVILDGGNTGLPLRVRSIGNAIEVSVSHITIRNGSGDGAGFGGAIYNDESLTLEDVKITNSNTSQGGAIFNDGDLSLIDSIITGNSSASRGVISDQGVSSIIRSTISGNNSAGSGAVSNISQTMVIIDSAIYNNTGAGGLYNQATMTIRNSTIAQNISSNNGGGVLNRGTLSLASTTIIGNTASSGGGIANGNNTTTIGNSIIANNRGDNCTGTGILSAGFNIDSGNTCQFSGDQDRQFTDPLVASLGNYSGATLTFGLFANSPAIDSGDPLNCQSTDQRGGRASA